MTESTQDPNPEKDAVTLQAGGWGPAQEGGTVTTVAQCCPTGCLLCQEHLKIDSSGHSIWDLLQQILTPAKLGCL